MLRFLYRVFCPARKKDNKGGEACWVSLFSEGFCAERCVLQEGNKVRREDVQSRCVVYK